MAVKIIPISEMRQKLKDILDSLAASGDPYFITQYSHPKAVLMRYSDYNSLIEQAAGEHPRIARRSDVSSGEPILRGTRITVRHIVERFQSGQPIEEILHALPDLTAAQVYDALSYYYDHQTEIDQLIAESTLARVVAENSLKVERVTEGVAVVHDTGGRE